MDGTRGLVICIGSRFFSGSFKKGANSAWCIAGAKIYMWRNECEEDFLKLSMKGKKNLLIKEVILLKT